MSEGSRHQLRTWREENSRRSEEVVAIFEDELSQSMHKLGDERWVIYEQVCFAACDCQRIDIVEHCLQELGKEFPGSLRVRKLRADMYIALERYSDALEILDGIIKKDETSAIPRKRKIAVLKAQGKIVDAVKDLCEYLKKFQADQEAWLELSELYLSQHDYTKATFCLEELILHNPSNHLYYERYAEIRFVQGGYDNVELAQSYFCQAAKLNPRNLRALRGISTTCNFLLSSSKTPATKKKDLTKLQEWVLRHLKVREEEDDEKAHNSIINLMSDLVIRQDKSSAAN